MCGRSESFDGRKKSEFQEGKRIESRAEECGWLGDGRPAGAGAIMHDVSRCDGPQERANGSQWQPV